MITWITEQKNIAWLNDKDFGYFYDAFWNPPPYQPSLLGYEKVFYGWLVLK